jgi:hypothetical protein
VDECAEGSHLCSMTCVNTPGSYHCSCPDGFLLDEDGITCHDVDECQCMNNGCQHSCVNEVGSYSCACDRGFILADGGFMCLDVDECSVLHNGFCSQLCINTEGSYHCDCREGYRLFESSLCQGIVKGYRLFGSSLCQDVDECGEMTDDCNSTGTVPAECINHLGHTTAPVLMVSCWMRME